MSTSSLAYSRAPARHLAARPTIAPPVTLAPSPALAAYDALAPHYDDFTAGYQHERWLGVIEALALEHGLRGRRLLDVACGTGKSFAPMLTRGYATTACDISPEMVAIARERAAGQASVFVADMRALPDVGRFDLVTCLDDALNYIVDPGDLGRALKSIASRLAAGGLLVFDVNTLRTYRETFCQDFDCGAGGRRFRWHAASPAAVKSGSLVSARLEVCETDGSISSSLHVQRHYSSAALRWALRGAGLEVVAVHGQLPGAQLEQPPNELRHSKLLWLARPAALGHRERRPLS